VIALDIMVEGGEWGAIPDAEPLAQKAAEAATHVAGREAEALELSLMLTDDAQISELNRTWRGKDGPTNVLSFPAPAPPGTARPGDAAPRYLGDIALAYETLAREAEEESKPLAHHFAHLVVHGVLHLLGYDHEVETEAERMEDLEVKALSTLGIADPYRDMAA
jgi:probable rRNA maturation factor